MASTNTLARIAHDLSLATWFGGSLMGVVGLNAAASHAQDPPERTRLSSLGWARWAPVQVAAIGINAVSGMALMVGNYKRVAADSASQVTTVAKTVATLAAMGASGYSGWLGKQIAEQAHEGAQGATEPSDAASKKLASAQKQQQVMQWVTPALTGVLVVLGAQQGEQQRGPRACLTCKHPVAKDRHGLSRGPYRQG